ncbi:hypothetical protein MMC22_011199 [Lobaria immixta]|nr:hypothetical protein [Lobaria immixta]
MKTRIDVLDYNAQARQYNPDVISPEEFLEPIKTSTNVVAPGFPEMVLQLFGFTVRQMDALFASYNMPPGGTW